MRKRFSALLCRACVTMSAVAVLTLVVLVAPAAANDTTVGPCKFNLDNPHISSQILQLSNVPVMRAHSRYYCTSELLSVSAKVSLRYCGPTQLEAEACSVLDTDPNTHTHATGIHYGNSYSPPFTTSDSDPYPQSGFYVTTAVYSICIFNGGEFSGTGKSQYTKYDATTGKVEFVKETGETIIET